MLSEQEGMLATPADPCDGTTHRNAQGPWCPSLSAHLVANEAGRGLVPQIPGGIYGTAEKDMTKYPQEMDIWLPQQ